MTIGEIQSMQQEETSPPPGPTGSTSLEIACPRRCVSAPKKCSSVCTSSRTRRSRGSTSAPVGTHVLHAVSQGCLFSQRRRASIPAQHHASRLSHREGGSVGSVGKPVGGESRSWETFNGSILLPRPAPLLNKQLI